jgi:hypothetical protein
MSPVNKQCVQTRGNIMTNLLVPFSTVPVNGAGALMNGVSGKIEMVFFRASTGEHGEPTTITYVVATGEYSPSNIDEEQVVLSLPAITNESDFRSFCQGLTA